LSMKHLALISLFSLVTLTLVNNVECQNIPQTSSKSTEQKQSPEIISFLERFKKPEHLNLLQSALWTVTHDYTDRKHMQKVLEIFQNYIEAIGKYEAGDPVPLEKIGGVKALKEQLAIWLKDEDQAIRAFAAVIIGISGDKSYAPQLANLLKKEDHKDHPLSIYDRSRAATALGMIGAKKYMSDVVPLLKSKNQYDRAGAITALEYFGAKEYSKEIADLLINKDFQFDDEPSPVFFLVETRTAQNHKRELVQTMLGEFRSETRKAAMYALVNLDSKENAKDIAMLLNDEFKKGDAAKALALLDANEYTNQIAAMLKDESSLRRADAALALGVLRAKKYASDVAKLLKDKESFVSNYAAVSLLLMEATEYYKMAIPLVEEPFSKGAYLTDSSFHPLVAEKTRQVTANLKKSFEQAKLTNK
jgi:HEAT repeat protein